MIDRDVIQAKFDIVERNLKFLEDEYVGKNPEEVKGNYKEYQALKFSLFEIVEACIDVANHIIAGKRLERAEEYSRMFTVLGENEIISQELAYKLSKMARFRNFLVHRYWELDVEYVIGIVEENLGDIKEFMKQIGGFLKRE